MNLAYSFTILDNSVCLRWEKPGVDAY